MEHLETYACYNTNMENRMKSSSGAVFSALAEYVFSENGVVYGVAMSEDCYSAEFISVKDENGLSRLKGSKYFQAKVGNAYRQAKQDLLEGKLVLFTGTGCQINGLKNFLAQDYENLICVDIICHGIPSPALWKEYVEYQEKKYGKKIINVNFRCKDNGEVTGEGKENQRYISKDRDSFMRMFLRNHCLRPSCYECVAKKVKKSDLTIGDFWGIDDVVPEMYDGKGCSLVIVRTEIGKKIFRKINKNLKYKSVSYEEGVKENSAEYQSVKKSSLRDSFFSDMQKLNFEELENKYAATLKVSFVRKLKQRVKHILKLIKKDKNCGNETYGMLLSFKEDIE